MTARRRRTPISNDGRVPRGAPQPSAFDRLAKGPNYLGQVDLQTLARRPRRLPAISLFTGVGGGALGLEQAGFDVRVMVERDPSCCATLRLNFIDNVVARRRTGTRRYVPPVILERDITTVAVDELLAAARLRVGEAAVLEGSFPCQGLSTASKWYRLNRREPLRDPRNALYAEFVRLLRGTLPRTFLSENVPGLVAIAGGRFLKHITTLMAACGYAVQWDILDAADYGVPQHRRRIFWIGERNDRVVLHADGSLALYMAAWPGPIRHPDWFVKKFGA